MADSLTALKAAMQQGWRPGGIQDDAEPSPEPDTWWGGFKQQLGRELNLPGLIDSATIRPRDTKLDTLAQFAPYLMPTAPGTPSPATLVKNLLSRTAPTHAQRLMAAEDAYAAAKGPRSPAQIAANTVELRPTPTAAPAAPGFSISPTLSEAELNARLAARRAVQPTPVSEIVPEFLDAGEIPPGASEQYFPRRTPVTPLDQIPKGRGR